MSGLWVQHPQVCMWGAHEEVQKLVINTHISPKIDSED